MKQHFAKLFLAATFLFGMASQSQAAIITSHFLNLGGNHWTVDLSLTNNDLTQGVNEFTVYFSESLFSNLTVLNSPVHWDGLVAQPDVNLASPGFFDAYNSQALALGKTQSGFTVGFTLAGQENPSALPFDLLDDNFQIIASGNSLNAQVGEPSLLGLILLGIFSLSWRRVFNRNLNAKS